MAKLKSLFSKFYYLELTDRRAVQDSILLGSVWIWTVYCLWPFLTLYLYSEYSSFDNLVSRGAVGLMTLAYFILFNKFDKFPELGHWRVFLMAVAPSIQMAYFAFESNMATYYVLGGMMAAAATTALFTSIRTALTYIAINCALQVYLVLNLSPTRDGLVLVLGHLVIHVLILTTLIVRLRAMNRATEESLRHHHQLVIANSLSTAAVMIAHDLRSPLSALSILSERSQDSDGELFRSAVENVSTLSSKLLILGRQVVDQQKKDRTETLDVNRANQVITFVANLLEYGYPGKVTLDLCEESQKVSISIEELERITGNLIKNAIEACEKSGEIGIKTECAPGKFVLKISDNGPGIEESVLQKILSSGFFSSKVGGSGIGLQSVLHLTRRNGGTLGYTANQPSGAVFTVELPLG